MNNTCTNTLAAVVGQLESFSGNIPSLARSDMFGRKQIFFQAKDDTVLIWLCQIGD